MSKDYYVISVEEGICYDKEDHSDHVELLVWHSGQEAQRVAAEDEADIRSDGLDVDLNAVRITFDPLRGPYDHQSDQWIYSVLSDNGYSVDNGYVNGFKIKFMDAEAA